MKETKFGDLYVSYVAQRPEVAIVNKISASLIKLEQEFGLTPVSRKNVKGAQKKERDLFAEFMNN